ncbi:MAG: outer membrane protein [Xanthobacteraceae bacterium]|jgi:outer membrane immunogenic protein
MKRILIAGALALAAGGQALAADLPQPAPPPPPRAPATYVPTTAPVYNWGGVYFGINGGYGFGKSNWTPTGAASIGAFNTSGFLVGGTLGANYQMGAFVLGVEGDIDWANLDGKSSTAYCSTILLGATSCETKSNWLGTARARVGYAFDRILLYGTGGGAFGNLQAGMTGGNFSSATEYGWTAGAGIEAAFAQNWTAKIEYLYVDFGNATCNGACGIGIPTTVSLTESLVRAGINYKFSF